MTTFPVPEDKQKEEDLHEYNVECMKRYWTALRSIAHTLDTYEWDKNHDFFTLDITDRERNQLLELRLRNKKKLLTFSSEIKGDGFPVLLCAFKSKSYQVLSYDPISKKTSDKLVLKGVVKSLLDHKSTNMLKFFMSDKYYLYYNHRSIHSKNHQLMLSVGKRIVVSKYYDKRYLYDSIHSLSYGHYFVKIMQDVHTLLENILDEIELLS